jgi:ABC-type lipopolysaccharide export system ATPase subunit
MTVDPIPCEEIAEIITQAVNNIIGCPIADHNGNTIMIVAVATGQVFRTTVTEATGEDLGVAGEIIRHLS